MMDAMKRSYTEKFNTTRNAHYFDFLRGQFQAPMRSLTAKFLYPLNKKILAMTGNPMSFRVDRFQTYLSFFPAGKFLIAFDALKGEKAESRVDLLPCSELERLIRKSQADT